MKIIRFSHGGQTRYGVLEGERISALAGDVFADRRVTSTHYNLAEVTLLAPVQPLSILCIGKNYKAHIEEFKSQVPPSPILFIKAANSLHDPGAPVPLPAPELTTQIDYEAELAIVIGRTAKNVSAEKALDYVFGYTCANDVTARDWQAQDGQWARGKSLDGFCPIGPWIETELNPADLRVEGRLNGVVMQSSRTSMLIFPVPYLISYLSRGMTLLPGTVLLTGTPSGCGFARTPPVFLRHGDVYEVDVEGIGALQNSFYLPGKA